MDSPDKTAQSSQDRVLCLESLAYEGRGLPGMVRCLDDAVLSAGEWAVVERAQAMAGVHLGDVLCGLEPPRCGRVLWRGKDWAALEPDEAATARSHIGRVFHGAGWLSNLDIDENLELALRYHRGCSRDEARDQLLPWARRFGFDELPGERPSWFGPADLARLQWVRALAIEPDLVLLEEPLGRSGEPDPEPLLEALIEVRARGAAVLIVSHLARLLQHPLLKQACRWPCRDVSLSTFS